MKFPKVPLVGDFKSSQIEARGAKTYDMDLYFCQDCYLLQILQKVDLKILFEEYSFSSSTIPNLVMHFHEYANWIKTRFNPASVLDVGCNDGVLLAPLNKYGIQTFGLDISKNITQKARDKGLNVFNLRLGMENIDLIKSSIGTVDIITSSNAFPHNDKPHDFIDAALEILNKNGTILFEVMYAGDLQEKTQWDTVYHEHLHFHSLKSLSKLLEMHGLYINHAELLPMHAGSLRIAVSKATIKSRELIQLEDKENYLKINEISSWVGFSDKSFKSMSEVQTKIEKLSEDNTIWAYGASGRATMWITCANLSMLEGIVDASPLRSGKFVPLTGTPITSPEIFSNTKADYTFITAWNYANEIMRQHREYKGKWLVPLPSYSEIKLNS
jgi:SAM-dependent methyltransferase